jgi:putative glutamine amidotransferase
MSAPRIAIPIPTSNNDEYNARSLPQFKDAISLAGGTPVEVPLTLSPADAAQLISTCQGVLLPGSPNDINPQKYGEAPIPETAPADPAREAIDELLIQDAHNLHKPMLCICAGVQAVNVWRNGSLIQNLPAPDETHANHSADRTITAAHTAALTPNSLIAKIYADSHSEPSENKPAFEVPVNSSHHQALKAIGDGLRVTAVSPRDSVIEAVENIAPDHFLLGVQWHPERLNNPFNRAIFTRFISEAAAWKPRTITESIG